MPSDADPLLRLLDQSRVVHDPALDLEDSSVGVTERAFELLLEVADLLSGAIAGLVEPFDLAGEALGRNRHGHDGQGGRSESHPADGPAVTRMIPFCWLYSPDPWPVWSDELCHETSEQETRAGWDARRAQEAEETLAWAIARAYDPAYVPSGDYA